LEGQAAGQSQLLNVPRQRQIAAPRIGHFVMLLSPFRLIYLSGSIFSMLTALGEEKSVFLPFIFNKLTALGDFPD
jgi:hypothetical protein